MLRPVPPDFTKSPQRLSLTLSDPPRLPSNPNLARTHITNDEQIIDLLTIKPAPHCYISETPKTLPDLNTGKAILNITTRTPYCNLN